MKLDRRTVLRLLAPSILFPALPLPSRAAAPSDALFVVIEGIDPTTPADRLRAFLVPFLDAGIPFGLAPHLSAWSDPASADVLRRTLAEAPERVEPILSLPGVHMLPAYFQRREASDAIARMGDVPAGGPATAMSAPVTIATDAPGFANFDALRCLGIRNVLELAAGQSVASQGCAGLTVCLRGATRLALADRGDPAPWLESVFAGPGWVQLALSLSGVERLPLPDVRLRAQRIVDAIGRELAEGRRFVALPREHARWFGADQLRLVALRIERGTQASPGALAALEAELRTLGIDVTETVPAGAGGAGGDDDAGCRTLVDAGQGAPGPADMGPGGDFHCMIVPAGSDRPTTDLAADADLLLVPGAAPAFDGRGPVIRGETPVSEAAGLLAEGASMRDAVLVIAPADYATAPARRATLDALQGFRLDPGTRLVDVPTFFRTTTSPDPVFGLLRDARRHRPDEGDPEALSAEELLADARQAWSYFERFSVAVTGLCVDTADVQEDGVWLHREMTMWDLGSLIAAVMAAHELGLIPERDFVTRSELLVRALPVTRVGELRLPCEVISSDTGAPLSEDFNACDTGRLLSVLRMLDAYPPTRGIAGRKIAGWDLSAVVKDGHVHSVVKGRLADRFRSHCAHYTARAFRARGIDAASPYEVPDMAPGPDRDMRLLLALAGLGPLGAEPLLLEALEMGLSEPANLLADVLFAAQSREHESSGRLVCLSEAPINREPWFTYQGLNVTSVENRWAVNAASADARFNTPAFRHETMLVNSKAAYLWVAARPSAYATLLARHVRARARIDGMGFSPGVFAASGEGMKGYSDVNTNGIILEAVAYILRGRRPPALR